MTALREQLQGITPPLVTPFDGTRIDWPAYESLLDHVLDGGVTAVFPCGTTGEAASLTRAERRTVVEHTVEHVGNDVPVLAGGTEPSVAGTREWIAEAADIGVDAIVLTAPYFHTANDPSGYLQFFEEVVDGSSVPILLYNIPGYVGEDIPPEVVSTLAEDENVIGLKDSSGDLGYGMTIQERTPDAFLLFQGFDELLLPSLRIGFDGGINAGSNAFPEDYASVVDAPSTDRALSIHQHRIRPLFALCAEHGFAPGMKAVLVNQGVIDSADVRPPLVPIEPETAAAQLP